MTADEQRQLDRVESKIDHHYEELVALKIDLAAHQARAGHDAQIDELRRLTDQVGKNRATLRAWGIAFGGIVLVINLAAPIILRHI